MSEWQGVVKEWESLFDGIVYNDPRNELRARAAKAATVQDTHIAVSVELIKACLAIKECEARTVVNGDPRKGTLIEIKCQRLVDPSTGKHTGMHVHGRINWPGPVPEGLVLSDPLLELLEDEREFSGRLIEELSKWGWGDVHYGEQPQERSVAELIEEYQTRRAANEQSTSNVG